MNYNEKAEEARSILRNFIQSYHSSLDGDKSLIIDQFQPHILWDLDLPDSTLIEREDNVGNLNETYNFIAGIFPIGSKPISSPVTDKFKVNKNWDAVYRSLKHLDKDGVGLFILEPGILFQRRGKAFLEALVEKKYNYTAVFNTPENILMPETGLRPVILAFQKTDEEGLYIADLEYGSVEDIVNNCISRNDSGNIETGLLVNRSEFESFSSFRFKHQAEKLKTQYKDYEEYQLNEIAEEINLTKETFEEKNNAIYIPNIGDLTVVSSIDETTKKHQNYIQVVLDSDIVLNDYLSLFYRSQLGKLILQSQVTGTTIPRINKSDIVDSKVAIPSIDQQKIIIHTNSKLKGLQKTISELQDELSLNPNNTDKILEKVDKIQEPLEAITHEDKILSDIRQGEGKHIEFKETFSKNTYTGQKDEKIQNAVLKTIVGFLNTDGGTILVGVADDGSIKGIGNDFFQSADNYLLHFKNHLKDKIGTKYYPYIDYDIYNVLNHKILKVDCDPSSTPCWLNDNEFYVRTNPATDRLDGSKEYEYINRRFK